MKGLFLDRDGTIIKDCEGALIESNIRFEDGLKDFIRFAIEKKFKIIIKQLAFNLKLKVGHKINLMSSAFDRAWMMVTSF